MNDIGRSVCIKLIWYLDVLRRYNTATRVSLKLYEVDLFLTLLDPLKISFHNPGLPACR